jgi:hypothetical protein
VDDVIAYALLRKRNPVIDAELRSSRNEGKIESLLAVLEARGLVPSAGQQERIAAQRSVPVLDRWLLRVATCQSVEELLG